MKKIIVKGIIEKPLIIEKTTTIICEPKTRCVLVEKLKKNVKIHVKNNAEIFYICMEKSEDNKNSLLGAIHGLKPVVLRSPLNRRFLELKNGALKCAVLNQTPFFNKKAIVEKNATIHWIEVYTDDVDTCTFTELQGVYAHATSTVLFIGNSKEKYKITHQTIHKAKKTTSEITMFGTVEHAYAYTTAKTIIEKKARGAVAHQKLKTILLDDTATASALPEMNIHNYDIQATHNASVGHIKPELLFYMTTRGIDEHEAKQQIVNGYFTALLQRFDDTIKIFITNAISKKLGEHYV